MSALRERGGEKERRRLFLGNHERECIAILLGNIAFKR